MKSFVPDVCLENTPAAESSAGAQPAVAALPEDSERTSSSSAPGTEAEPNEGANSPHSKEEQDNPAPVKDTNGDITPAGESGTTTVWFSLF